MRSTGAAPSPSAKQDGPEARPWGPFIRSLGTPEWYSTPPWHGGVPDNISFLQVVGKETVWQGCAVDLVRLGVNNIMLEEIFGRLEAAKSKLQGCTMDDIATRPFCCRNWRRPCCEEGIAFYTYMKRSQEKLGRRSPIFAKEGVHIFRDTK
uniref:Uncharacterized protein n=1 Tax=Corethron hystrix TaxID=216773 RepID=A0A7S1BS56_9STRA|mmetsp:Transcript_39112/g.91080  ORF Transcript_39112/g.91080 Transcript_39112/m.91080 type:complete len:151 (+) Transcript_39112:1180-1632(+)